MLAMVLWVTVAAPVENGELTRARTLYSEMHYEAALKALVKAITSPGLTPQDRAQVYFYTGLCRHQAGDEAGALAAFKEALTIDRALELPAEVGPKTRRAFEKARSELPPPLEEPTPPPAPPPQVEQAVPAPIPTPVPVAVPVAALPSPPQDLETPAPVRTKRWWPAVVSFGIAAACLGGGIYAGTTASSTSAMAMAAPFASDGLSASAAERAQRRTLLTAANILYVIAGKGLRRSASSSADRVLSRCFSPGLEQSGPMAPERRIRFFPWGSRPQTRSRARQRKTLNRYFKLISTSSCRFARTSTATVRVFPSSLFVTVTLWRPADTSMGDSGVAPTILPSTTTSAHEEVHAHRATAQARGLRPNLRRRHDVRHPGRGGSSGG